jgi:hypothetical protein
VILQDGESRPAGALWRFCETSACAAGRLENTMDRLDRKSPDPGGGRASNGGRFYHFSFRSGSRASGACARASYEYVTREGEFAGDDRDPVIYIESDHMPAWAADEPRAYWDAADLYERANGRLYVSADFALPRDLSTEERAWLEAAQRTIAEAERWRQEEQRRYWPGVAYRWITALAFALLSAVAVGTGYAWIAKPFATELEALRPRADLGLLVEHRMSTMTAAERRQLDRLMGWKGGAR